MAAKHSKKRLGLLGYARIMRDIAVTPRTPRELCERHDMRDEKCMRAMMLRFYWLGLCHPVTFLMTKNQKGPPTWHPLWKFGPGEAPPCPAPYSLLGRPPPHVGTTTFGVMIRALQQEGGITTIDLAEETGVRLHTLRALIIKMRAMKLVYVAHWGDRIERPHAHFSIGINRNDAARPKRYASSAIRTREYRARRKLRDEQTAALFATAGRASNIEALYDHHQLYSAQALRAEILERA